MTCPHGICYGLKWLLRHEGPRDHVDMVMNLAALPNVIVLDMANMMVAHARNRGYNVFQPFEGRVAECTPENIRKAKAGELEIDWPWFPMARNRTQEMKLRDLMVNSFYVTLRLDRQIIIAYLINFMKKILLIQLIVYVECRASTNLLGRPIQKRLNN